MRREVVRTNHDEMGHFGTDKTLERIKQSYWFPRMREYVEKYITSCVSCLYHKKPRGKKEGFLNPIEKIAIPFHTIHADHLGPFNNSCGKKYILAIVDSFTKFIIIRAVRDTKTSPVVKCLKELITVYGVPNRIITDRGTAFTSANFRNFCNEINVKHIMNAVATPRANGQVERYNSTILAALSTTIKKEKEWAKNIEKVQFSLNNTINSSTGVTPSQVLMGYQPRSTADALLTNEIQPETPTVANLTELREHVADKISKQQQKRGRKLPLTPWTI